MDDKINIDYDDESDSGENVLYAPFHENNSKSIWLITTQLKVHSPGKPIIMNDWWVMLHAEYRIIYEFCNVVSWYVVVYNLKFITFKKG